jgi:hypothetical protein
VVLSGTRKTDRGEIGYLEGVASDVHGIPEIAVFL